MSLDVGGASCAYGIEAVRRYPQLQFVVVDRPGALEVAREKIAEAGYTDRIRTYARDFLTEELPQGSDVMPLSMIFHDWTPETKRAILQKCSRTLPSGGAVIVSELMMDDDKTGLVSAALMSLTMLIETEGRNDTWAEYAAWLKDVGFRRMRRIPITSLRAPAHSPGQAAARGARTMRDRVTPGRLPGGEGSPPSPGRVEPPQ